ncbi:MAG: ABC transporter ATP-binding protein/permease [Bacilli bacterium]|nr:ABC transporter ATP-binding protein/permease [Bacilli bacterium]
MLELNNITKVYSSEDIVVQALNDVSLKFRESEFVAILGPSGCGKTTLLNIIGGLDNYTDGNLIINGKSTKKYTDNDWDLYRNHKVGFVFQSYNLIPHQNALSNVELALTLSGVSKNLRRQRAIEALKKVGLADQLYKKPSQMSGGQTQRIAIARALVNNPDILLADEPTGALDSETSIQIMDLLKEIAKDRLVIMVTHNPDLAKKYATRIINLSDGKITGDSNPYDGQKIKNDVKKVKTRKNFMSFKTALGLSLNNLSTKKGRTILTSFAGAIGIIGIALVLSISTGVRNYIASVEKDTLSSYPIMIEAKQIDASSLLETMKSSKEQSKNESNDTIVTNDIMGNMISIMSKEVQSNDLKTFKKHLEKNKDKYEKYSNAIQYGYNLNLQIYKNTTDEVVKLNPNNILESFGMNSNSLMSVSNSVFMELLDNDDFNKKQYEVLAGSLPKKYDEVVLIVDDNNKISDYTAYTIGLKDTKELDEVMAKLIAGEEVDFEETSFTYDELLNTSFKVILNTDYYQKSKSFWINMENDEDYMKSILANALEIKIVGIVKINSDSVLSGYSSYGNIGYTKGLKKYVINKINESEIAKEQLANPEINVLNNMPFSTGDFNINNLSIENQMMLASLTPQEITNLISSYSNSSYEGNLLTLGIVDLDNPSMISIYPKDFDSKDALKDLIDNYNQKKQKDNKDEEVISYTDYVGLLMSSVTTIVDVISYVLIAFVSVSLIVSSIMIGIITYISVLERTKEIGILRSIGASKKDISRVFNAETFIVGSFAGIIGILITIILDIPINLIIKKLSGISHIASLPIIGGIILVIISILLTVIAGLIPSKMASKKDPVEALRSE